MLHALYQVILVKLADSSSHPSTRIRGPLVLRRHGKTVSILQIYQKRKQKKKKKG